MRHTGALAVLCGTLCSAHVASIVHAEPVDWNAIAQCESGGDWSADTGNGHYGGLQISQESWLANGGNGSPATAAPQEQIRVAQNIMSSQGPGAWPTCAVSTGSNVPGSVTYLLAHLSAVTRKPCLIPIQCW